MPDVADVCMHKEVDQARKLIMELYGLDENISKVMPIGYCKSCEGKLQNCAYYKGLGDIRREFNKGLEEKRQNLQYANK